MSSNNTYYKELTNENMETAKLMQQNVNEGANLSEGAVNEQNGGVVVNDEAQNGCVLNGNVKQPESIEMSTSTTSLKCCNGFLSKSRKIVKETQTQNGTQNGGINYFNTLKEKFQNGKPLLNGGCKQQKVKVEKVRKPVVFDDRDPFRINSDVRYEFQNLFAEPNSGTYSWTPIWSFTNSMYFNLKLYLYRLFAVLIGIPAAFICAVFFALFSVLQIWIIYPLMRIFFAILAIFRTIWSTLIDAVFGPVFQLFSYIRAPVQCNNVQSSATSSKSIYNDDNNVV